MEKLKYIGRYKNNALQLSRTLSTAFYVGFIATMLISFLCYYNAELVNVHRTTSDVT